MCYRGKLFKGDNEPLFRKASTLLKQLEHAGHAAFIVGGGVRDALLARKVHDLDIATSAVPTRVQALFPHTAPTGLKHGTVTVISGQYTFEVTTFRREGPYQDARHPNYVQFVQDLTTDLARRDFTINAMACNHNEEIVDPFDGMADLRTKTIRCVGCPQDRFREDALRILRAIRLTAQLDFHVEPVTRRAMRAEKAGLAKLAMERVTHELDKLLSTSRPGKALRLFWTEHLWREIQPFSSQKPALPREEAFAQLDAEPDPDLRWILLLRMVGVTENRARATLRRFKMPRKVVHERALIWHEAAQWPGAFFSVKQARQRVFTLGLRRLLKTIRLAYACGDLTYTDWRRLCRQFCHADWHLPLEEVSQLALDGHALLQLCGREAGPWLGEVRQALLEKVVTGDIANTAHDLEKEWRRHGPHAP